MSSDPLVIGPSPLRRLTNREYLNALRDLFPDVSVDVPQLPSDNAVAGFENAAEAQDPSDVRIARTEEIANLYAEAATTRDGGVAALVGCVDVSSDDAAMRCGAQFVSAIGARVPSGHVVRQFMRVIRLALACDLTRVVTFLAPVPQCTELGYPGSETVHGYAHQSILGSTSCGQMYNPVAERAMTDLDAWHAAHLAYLLQELDAVPEGAGTLLDHTVVVWLTELATPTHQHHDAHVVLAGGCNGFFETGRYVRYPRTLSNPLVNQPLTGPPHNRLLVSLMQAMGQSDTSFGMTDAQAADGTTISFRGPLEELHRWR